MSVQRYRELFDRQLRGRLVPEHRDVVSYRDLSDLDEPSLDGFVRARRDGAWRDLEWTVHEHDVPAELPERLLANGFALESSETVMFATAAELPTSALPEQVRLREVSAAEDLNRIRALIESVWGFDHGWLPAALTKALSGDDGDPCVILVAESTAGELVCASWMRFHTGTVFASLWGGSTLPAWQGRGIYRATVGYRARLAVHRGYDLLRVDASPDSAPILARLGFVPVTTVASYVWHPVREQSNG